MSAFRRQRLSLASIARLRVAARMAWLLALLLVFSNAMAFASVTLPASPTKHAGAAHCAAMKSHAAANPCCQHADCGCAHAVSPLPTFPSMLGMAWISPASPIFPPQSAGIPAGTSAPPLRPPIA